eukprot:4240256-Amphidinium_carterae.1
MHLYPGAAQPGGIVRIACDTHERHALVRCHSNWLAACDTREPHTSRHAVCDTREPHAVASYQSGTGVASVIGYGGPGTSCATREPHAGGFPLCDRFVGPGTSCVTRERHAGGPGYVDATGPRECM